MPTSTETRSPAAPSRELAAGALAALGAVTAVPLALAQLDFAGVVDVFSIETDTPRGLLVLAAVGGCLTLVTIAAALAGAVLALAGSSLARPFLWATAIAGFASSLMLWLPHGVALAAAASLLPRTLTNR